LFYNYHCGDTYDGGISVPEGIIHPCFIAIIVEILMMAVYKSPRVLSALFYNYHCGDTYDGGVLVPEGIIHPCFITITVEIFMMAVYQSLRVLSTRVVSLSLWRYL
jgi:hypothetical protein